MKPILFQIGSFPIYSFGVMIALGVLLSLILISKQAPRIAFAPAEVAQDFVFVTVLSGFLGARAYYVIQNFHWYADKPLRILMLWEGGLIFYGGVVGALVGLYIFSKLKKISYLKCLDFLTPYVALTHAFGRIGCFLNGCCHGKVCSLPWAVQFPELREAVHPVQIYEAVFSFGLFFFLYALSNRKPFVGKVVSLYFIFYSIGRFVLEFFRGDTSGWLITHNQWFSLALCAAGGVLYLMSQRKSRV